MKRPETFSDVIGHNWLVQYLTQHIEDGSLHHFLILEGPEGIGKTSLADIIALSLVYGISNSEQRHTAYEQVVVKGESNDNIKRFKCSVDGGKDVARIIKDEMNTTFAVSGPKVIICDECHGLTEQAQDVFLSETEFIADNVYIIMLTTEVNKLKASLRSRAVPIHLKVLTHSDMVRVLKQEVHRKNLRIQNEEAMLSMIADWAECKPRTGLNILNAFSDNSAVSSEMLRELIGFLDVKDVLPVLTSLSGSLTFGLKYIEEMPLSSSMIDIVIECINVKAGNGSYKLKFNEMNSIREQLESVSLDQLVQFLYGITKSPTLTRTMIINAYISAHASREVLTDQSSVKENLALEDIQRSNIQIELDNKPQAKAPSIEDLLSNGKVIV